MLTVVTLIPTMVVERRKCPIDTRYLTISTECCYDVLNAPEHRKYIYENCRAYCANMVDAKAFPPIQSRYHQPGLFEYYNNCCLTSDNSRGKGFVEGFPGALIDCTSMHVLRTDTLSCGDRLRTTIFEAGFSREKKLPF
ncbi:hypothetical protein AVEN_47688-1 [Araneus ventricosus]|uniref:Uncharacterized protein n=1 Tax=Araneus ventricosus TaxID=182803 RepID=A0A4Y2HFC6_ARAVE|nr:hypothetical protein AVEN_47688-1 [Araneus ventricosus]